MSSLRVLQSADERSKQTGSCPQYPAVQGRAETNADLRSGSVGDRCKEPSIETPNIPEPDAMMGLQRIPVRQEHSHTPRRRSSTPNGLYPDHRNPSLQQNHEPTKPACFDVPEVRPQDSLAMPPP
ncbi:hypothetical protein Trydic_g8128 [Trypoxylus dichotomus]